MVGSTARVLRGGKHIFILQTIHCCFQQWKNFQHWLTVDEVIAKKFDTTFFETQCTSRLSLHVVVLRYTSTHNNILSSKLIATDAAAAATVIIVWQVMNANRNWHSSDGYTADPPQRTFCSPVDCARHSYVTLTLQGKTFTMRMHVKCLVEFGITDTTQQTHIHNTQPCVS